MTFNLPVTGSGPTVATSEDLNAEMNRVLELKADETSVRGIRLQIADQVNGDTFTAAVSSGGVFSMGWTQLFIIGLHDASGTSRRIAPRNYAEIANGQVLYIDLEETYVTEYTVLQAQATDGLYRDFAAGTKLDLFRAISGRPVGAIAPYVLRAIDAASGIIPAYGQVPLAETATMNRGADWQNGRKALSINSDTHYAHQSSESASKVVISDSDTVLDVSHLKEGETVDAYCATACNVYAGAGRTFAGTTDNNAAFLANSAFTVTNYNANQDMVIAPTLNAPTYSTITTPVMSRTWAFGGQSIYDLGLVSGGIGGLATEMQEASVINAEDKASTFYINGATSGSAIDSRSNGTNYWWDAATSQPGPALNTFIAELQAAAAFGQPTPEVVFWRQGEQDTMEVNNGTFTAADWRTSTSAVFDYILANGAAGAKFIVMPPGSNDDALFPNGALAIQDAILDLVDARTDTIQGCAMFDVMRPFGNVHPTDRGFYTLGVRDAVAYANVFSGGTISYGPVMGATTLANNDTDVVFNVNSSGQIAIPPTDRADGYSYGPHPFGFVIVNGDIVTNDPIEIVQGSVTPVDSDTLQVRLETNESLVGARVYSMAGQMPDVWKRQYIRDTREHGFALGFPMPFQRSDVLS